MAGRFRGSLALLLGLLLLAGGTQAQLASWVAVRVVGLSGGLNDAADPTTLTLTEASDLQNVVFTPLGGLARRDGFVHVNTVAGGVSTIQGFYRQADGTRFLVRLASGTTDQVEKMDYGAGTTGPDGTWDDITGAISLTISNDDLGDFAVAENEVVFEDGIGTTAPFKWTGTGNAAAVGGTPPNATMVEYHKRHLWTAGLSTARSRLTFSNLDDMEVWTSTDTIEVETDDGQVLTALRSALDCLYAFKTESIWRVCGASRDDFTLEQMVRGIGAANNQAVAVLNNQFVFLTSQGDVAVYNGGTQVEIISTKIEGTLSGLNLNRIVEAVAVAFDDAEGDDDFYLSVSGTGSGTHNRLLVFDTFHQAWTKFDGFACNALAVYEVGTQQRALLCGTYSGYTDRYPSGNSDAGEPIDAFYASGHYDFEVAQQKIFRVLQLVFQQRSTSHPIAVEYRIDFATTGTETELDLSGSGALWDTAVFDVDTWADLTTTLKVIHMDTPGDYLQWYLSEDSTAPAFLLRNLRVWMESTGRIGGSS